MTCPYIHSNISVLYGVPEMPIEKLPKVCTCGAPLTYAKVVMFAELYSDLAENEDVIKIEKVTK